MFGFVSSLVILSIVFDFNNRKFTGFRYSQVVLLKFSYIKLKENFIILKEDGP